ncbi:hypothetical protein Btru_025273 [Bulinus truncatus]|nr:hypothetical protein Btru_025273 [Bulinus truncatus]
MCKSNIPSVIVTHGYKPEKSGYKPETSGCKTETSGYEPEKSGYEPETSGYNQKQYGTPPGSLGDPLISFLLNFKAESYTQGNEPKSQVIFQYSNCSKTEWPSPNGDCLPLHCVPGKLLTNSACTSAFPEIFALDYRLRLWLIPVHPLPYPFDDLLKNVTTEFTNWFKNELSDYWIKGEMSNKIPDSDPSNKSITSLITIVADVTGGLEELRDTFESLFLSRFINNRIIVDFKGLNLTFQAVQAISKTLTFASCNEMRQLDPDIHCESYADPSNYKPPSDYLGNDPSRIDVSNLLHCAHVIFSQSDYDLKYSGSELSINFTMTIDLNVTKVTISDLEDVNSFIIEVGGELRVCQEVLDRKLEEIQNDVIIMKKNEDDEIRVALSFLSLVCTGLSLLGLVLTVLTYGMHPVLRTAAGRNNLMLSLSLLMAQTSTLAASNIEHRGPPCTTVSILTHFLWLWMFSWAFICGLHMFRVFKAKTRSSSASPGSETRDFVRRCALSFLFPVVIVWAVVVISFTRTGGQSVGYGTLSCWFDSLLLTVFAFTCPLMAVVLCNIIFFIITVAMIHRVRQLSSTDSATNRENQNNLVVYVKLSAMTGAFWVTALVEEVAGIDYLRY